MKIQILSISLSVSLSQCVREDIPFQSLGVELDLVGEGPMKPSCSFFGLVSIWSTLDLGIRCEEKARGMLFMLLLVLLLVLHLQYTV